MPADAFERDQPALYNFGDVAVNGDGNRVVVTELPDDPDSFPAVIVGEVGIDGINLILKPSGTIPVSELRKEPGSRWPVEMVTECVVRGQFGRGGTGEEVRALFREIFEKHSRRPGVGVPRESYMVGDEGLEPPTSSLSVTRSNQLS